jgi:hypothetical protein
LFLGRLSPWFLITIEIVIRGPNLFGLPQPFFGATSVLSWRSALLCLRKAFLGFVTQHLVGVPYLFGRLFVYSSLVGYLFTLIILQGTTCFDSCGASFRQVLLAEFCLWVMSLPIFPRGTALVVGFDVFLRISYHCT